MSRLSTGTGKRDASPGRTSKSSTPAGLAAGVARLGGSSRNTASGGRHVGSSGTGKVSTGAAVAARVPRLGQPGDRISQTKASGAVNGAQAGGGR